MPFIESFDEFKKRQQCESIQLENGGWIFSNGAAWTVQSFDGMERYASHSEPPTEKFALLRAQRLFVRTKQGREVKAYQAALTDYQQQARNAAMYPDNCPSVPPGAMDSLRSGWERLEKLRVELEAIDAELAQSPEAVAQRQAAEQRAAVAADRQRVQDQFLSFGHGAPPPMPVVPPLSVEELKQAFGHQPATSELFGTKR